MKKLNILVTGGSGYLGQFLLHKLALLATSSSSNASLIGRVAYTFSGNPLPNDVLSTLNFPIEGFQVELTSADGGRAEMKSALNSLVDKNMDLGSLVVINCAALATPATCETDRERAWAINVPTALVDSLLNLSPSPSSPTCPKIIHLSTDQVYYGDRAWCTESDTPIPVNAYAESKLAAESELTARWPKGEHVSLRSSIIFGPQSPLAPVSRALFLQFCDKVLAEKKPTTFFEDEYRCPVFAGDICEIVVSLLRGIAGVVSSEGQPSAVWPVSQPFYNMGGPDRLSRVDMAKLVAKARKVPAEDVEKVVLSVPASSVTRPYASPLDISMNIDALIRDTGVTPRSMEALIGEVLGL